LAWVLWEQSRGELLPVQPGGIAAAIGVGLAFTLVTIGLYLTFGAGAPVSVASPVIRLAGLLIVSLAGLVLLDEPFNVRYLAGVLLAVSGVGLILTR
jgi:drug/metabolite transporter (DMT)-like permease